MVDIILGDIITIMGEDTTMDTITMMDTDTEMDADTELHQIIAVDITKTNIEAETITTTTKKQEMLEGHMLHDIDSLS